MTEEYRPVQELYQALGYKDPMPLAGKWNKAAIKARFDARAKLNIRQYRIGERREYAEGGYIIVPIYEYKGIRYS